MGKLEQGKIEQIFMHFITYNNRFKKKNIKNRIVIFENNFLILLLKKFSPL